MCAYATDSRIASHSFNANPPPHTHTHTLPPPPHTHHPHTLTAPSTTHTHRCRVWELLIRFDCAPSWVLVSPSMPPTPPSYQCTTHTANHCRYIHVPYHIARIHYVFQGYKCLWFSLNIYTHEFNIAHAAKGCYSAKIFVTVFLCKFIPSKYTRYTVHSTASDIYKCVSE